MFSSQQLQTFQQAQRVASEQLHAAVGDQGTAHLVFPDPRIGRAPWIEVRCTSPIDDLVEDLEESWPSVEFESIWCDEESL